MAIIKSTYTGGNGRPFLHAPYVANVPAEALIVHTFNKAVTAADILELAYLPAHCKVLSCDILAIGTAAATATVGIMSGAVGSDDPARTSGAELFSAITPTTAEATALDKLAALAPADEPRSIGVKFSATVAANPATKLYLRIRYATGGQ